MPMVSALLLQTSRSLLVVLAVLLICRRCAAEPEVQLGGNFACAKTGVNLPGGLTITMDKQIRINPKELNDKELRGLLLDANDEKIVFTVVGGASCRKYFTDVKLSIQTEPDFKNKECVLSNEGAVASNHQPGDCPNCKAFTLSCPCIMTKTADLADARVFKINLKPLGLITQCQWRAYIDDARVLLDNVEDTDGEACVDATLGIVAIGLIAGGGVLFIVIVVAVIGWLTCRRKQQTFDDIGGVNVPQSAWAPSGGSKATNGTYKPKSTWSTFGLNIGSTTKTKGAVGRSKAESSGVAVPNTIWGTKTKGATTTNATANITKASGVTTAGPKKTFMSGAFATVAVGRTKADKSGVAVPQTLMTTATKGGATTAAKAKKSTGAYGVL
uniref:Uncharacterized protein n=1 Tax=Globodera rostochiensis TaxID=31243 RepID=A0A914HF04_GLORO